jgi:peptidoglycan/LPS O-acetylase OafA/YrhL
MHPPEPPGKSGHAGYVPALDGVRALAVLAVLGFHAEVPHLGGGFLGVEVFFVLSGYLITSLLLLELARVRRISLAPFWLRRARRLLPALFTLLSASLVLSLTLARDSLAETRTDAAAALFYVSNWWQVIEHRSYFMAVDRPPLLLHLWSLAVEEQFYLFWPLALALLGRQAARWVLPAALLGGLASALWMATLFDPSLDPTRVYVATDTRLSGLLLGAALSAVVRAPLAGAARQTTTRTAGREALAALGLGTLLVLMFSVTDRGPFLYRGGLVLVDLASCALIAGVVQPSAAARLLGARPCAWLGRRSYGLYLWHWPIFALTRPEFDLALSAVPLLAVRLTLTVALAELCYRFVEMPIRNGALQRLRRRTVVLGASATALLTLVVSLVSFSGARSAAARRDDPGRGQPTRQSVTSTPPEAWLSPSKTAAAQSAVPARLGSALNPAWPKTLTLLSDSVGLGLSRALPLALPGWKVEVLGRPALMVKQVVPEFLNARSVGSVVVIALAYNSLFERDRKNYEHWSAIWDRSAEKLLSELQACGAKKLVWITLREPSPESVTDAGRDQYDRYAWFFPYVNERIRALATRHPELALADWQAVSDGPDLTKDLIHLNPRGVALMTSTVTHAVLGADPASRATP